MATSEFVNIDKVDPLEGSSYEQDDSLKTELKDESDEETTNPLCFLELTEAESNQEFSFNTNDVMVNPKTGKLVCMYCFLELETSEVVEHMKVIHNYRKVNFKCYNCKMIFLEKELLKQHKTECNPDKHRKKTFLQIMKDVDSMIEGLDDFQPVSCPACCLQMPKYCLKSHIITEHDNTQSNVTCGVCNRTFKTKLTLAGHIKLVHNAIVDSEQCDQCGQKFSSLKYLRNHKRNVHPNGNKIFKCEYCEKEFKSHLNLHQHKKYVHPPKEARVKCPHCNKMFKAKANLKQHINVSHSNKRKKKSQIQ